LPVPALVPSALPEAVSALAAQPDFLAGLQDAQQVYDDNEYEGRLSEGEMMELVERNVSRRGRERDNKVCQAMGLQAPAFLYALGLVIGLIGTGCARQAS